ncbi:metallophosphoesterase family protein [Chitinophaga agrisoli]|nr:metallophosphoesterase [Chitinophaga agrisoli]
MTDNKNTISRRRFVASMGMLTASLPLGASAFNFIPSAGKGFSFMLLGDIHFTKEDFHDLEYVRTKFSPGDVTQVHNYSRISRENLQPLLTRTKEAGKKLNADFYLQLGDFVEGLCGAEELARKQTNGFIELVKQQELQRPFFVIKGNHDITGIGAQETFKEVVLPWQTAQQDQSLSTANSTFVHKDVRFILFDGYTPDESLSWLKGMLATAKEKTIFFCVHQPVVPFTARSNWHIFAKPSQQQQREELLNLLGQYNAIVLCGHLHKTSILTRTTKTGKFVQICTGSVIEHPDAPVKDHLEGLSAYGPSLLDLEPKFAPASLEERRTNLENEKPFIRYFEYADFMGYSTVTVSPVKTVQISIYRNMDNDPWKIIDVDKLLNA